MMYMLAKDQRPSTVVPQYPWVMASKTPEHTSKFTDAQIPYAK
jgi:hypothetical protein